MEPQVIILYSLLIRAYNERICVKHFRHGGNLDASLEVIQEAHKEGIRVGIISYSSLIRACNKVCAIKKIFVLYLV